jgi:16S rRNA (cytosine967-C5)-methyltransferase
VSRPTPPPVSAALSTVNLSRAAQLVTAVSGHAPVAAVLRRDLAPRRDLAEADRRDLARAVAAFFRWRQWSGPPVPLPRQIAAAVELQARFDADPAAVKPETLAARAVPGWIWEELPLAPAGPEAAAWLRQLQREPARWIRARAKFAATLPRTLRDCTPAAPPPGLPVTTAFRHTGTRDLFLTDEFQQGQFEIQDLASQLVGLACAPRPGETWWDACAGEGGKTLHLADLMANRGLIWASDRSRRRLLVLKQRAARAGVFNYRSVFWDGGPQPPTKTRFDGILVDAPCSGAGTWQRHPDARWSTSPADVRELAAVQRRLLDHVAPSLKPGGRLVYAVCTLTRSETSAVADRFSATHPEFEPAAVFPEIGSQRSEVSNVPPETADLHSLTSDRCPLTSALLWPQALDANGMFIAAWRKPA